MAARIVVIGNGTFAVRCLELMLERPDLSLALVVSDPEAMAMRGLVTHFCRQHDLPTLESTRLNVPPTLEAIRDCRPDYVFSLYNMRILKRALLDVPRLGTINFHNGPLPRYRGVNVYSWAILNGEREFGVTWHLVDEGIDTGDILAQQSFPIAPTDTPVTLIGKGFRAGVESLAKLLPALLDGRVTPRRQDESLATTYTRKDVPNGGRLSLAWPLEQLERFVRALDYRPLANPFVHPTLETATGRVHPGRVARATGSNTAPPGEILACDAKGIVAQAADGPVRFSDFLDDQLRPISGDHALAVLGVRVGERLA
jgi:methionyl-tRNA formyltransferase